MAVEGWSADQGGLLVINLALLNEHSESDSCNIKDGLQIEVDFWLSIEPFLNESLSQVEVCQAQSAAGLLD